jgi:hypothetical protein
MRATTERGQIIKKIARLAGFVSPAVYAIGLMGSSTALAGSGYLLLPVGGLVLGSGLAGTLKTVLDTLSCARDLFAAKIANVHLIGPFVVDFLGCKVKSRDEITCEAKSPNGGEGLILTRTLHAIIGLSLPASRPALVVLPTSGTALFTLAENECIVGLRFEGIVGGLLLAPVGASTTSALLDFRRGDPEVVDTLLSGVFNLELLAFGSIAEFETQVHLAFQQATEIMP